MKSVVVSSTMRGMMGSPRKASEAKVVYGQDGDTRDSARQQYDAEGLGVGVSVRNPASQIVAEADPGEHDAYYARPGVQRDSNRRRQYPARHDFDYESTRAGAEYDDIWLQGIIEIYQFGLVLTV